MDDMPNKNQHFKTTVQSGQSGERSRVFITLPFNPGETWGNKQRYHVAGTINGMNIRGSLGADGETYFIPLGAAWRRDCGVQPGDDVTVVLWPEGPQQDMLPEDVAQALEAEPQAGEFFASLATFYRKGYLRWVTGAKKPETRAARLNEMIVLLKAGKKQR